MDGTFNITLQLQASADSCGGEGKTADVGEEGNCVCGITSDATVNRFDPFPFIIRCENLQTTEITMLKPAEQMMGRTIALTLLRFERTGG